jgi:hypothetical protein
MSLKGITDPTPNTDMGHQMTFKFFLFLRWNGDFSIKLPSSLGIQGWAQWYVSYDVLLLHMHVPRSRDTTCVMNTLCETKLPLVLYYVGSKVFLFS